jgi:hypothetical protein
VIFLKFFKIILFLQLFEKLEIAGFVAEWLGRALQKLLQQFESARNLRNRDRPPKGGFFLRRSGSEFTRGRGAAKKETGQRPGRFGFISPP